MKKIDAAVLWKCFYLGISYGQLLAEEERENEEWFNAGICAVSTRKRGPLSAPVRRQVHSEKWFAAKRKDYKEFQELYHSFIQAEQKQAEQKPGRISEPELFREAEA
jgi:hypothetical protein